MRYVGKRDVWENCYYSTYGRDAALRYGEKTYCQCGEAYNVRDNRKVDCERAVCPDWGKCRGLDSVVRESS